MLKRLFNAVWLLAVAGLVMVAIALSAARLWVPTLAEYREDVERIASETLERPVTVARMQATWRGLYPVLRLRDVVLDTADPAQPPFAIPEIRLRVDLIHYLRHREVRFSGIDIIGVDLAITRDADGKFRLERLGGTDRGDSSGLIALLGMEHVSLHNADITFHDVHAGKAPRRFSAAMLSLTNDGTEHRLTGHARLPGDVGYRMQLDARFSGYGPDPRRWRGRVYVKGQQLLLGPLLAYWQPQSRARGVADLRLWIDVAAAQITSINSELDVRDLLIERKVAGHTHTLNADALGVQLGWRQAGDEWQSALRLHTADQPQGQWVPFTLKVSGGERDGIEHLHVSTERLVLDQLWQLLPAVPVLEVAHLNRLIALRPSGQLSSLDFLLTRSADEISVGRFEVKFEELGIAESADTPYVAGLDGVVSGTDEAGVLVLDSRHVDVTDSRLFRDILGFDELQGEIRWTRLDDGYHISSGPLALVNADMQLLTEFVLSMPQDPGGTHLDLRVDVESVDVARVSHYLPARIMSPVGVAWLDNSLVAGQVRNGSVRVLGRLDQLPYDQGEGQLEVRLPVFNATLDFNDGWSPITGLDAQVDFTGRSMDILSQRGRIRTADLQAVRARIRDLAKPRLTIDGGVRGELNVMLDELGSSPLGVRYGGFVDRAMTTGRCKLQLDLDIPLSGKQRDVAVAGRITLADNTLTIPDTVVALSGINGVLAFDGDGIEGDGLRTVVFGRPAGVRVWGEPGKPATHIRLDTRLALLDVLPDLKPPLRDAFSGDSDWQLQLTIHGAPVRGEPARVGLQASSTLADTAIALPAPLQKTADQERPVSINVDNVTRADRLAAFAYGDALHGVVRFRADDSGISLGRGTITLGGAPAVLSDQAGLLIAGQLAALHPAEWQAWLGGGQGGPAFPMGIDLNIGELGFNNYVLNDLHIAADLVGRVWTLAVSGDATQGEVELTKSGTGFEKVIMNMERLALTKSLVRKTAAKSDARPADMPELQITTGELVYNGSNFGELDLWATAAADNLYRIERLALSSDMLQLRLDGEWLMAGDRHQSRIDMHISGGQMGTLLDTLGYEKTMEGGRLSGRLQAAWAAPLWTVAPERIDGKLELVIKDGQLLDIDPGAGRALGLFNLGRLPRRLTLDFSDLFKEGFKFDRIGGNFVLDYGNIYTTDLEVDGPAAKIEISGRVGLADRDYDQLVTVIPYIESSLPLAGAIAGGPAVGAVAIVAEKLLEGKLGLNRMAQKQYTVTGSWDEPVVTRLEPAKAPETEVADVFDE